MVKRGVPKVQSFLLWAYTIISHKAGLSFALVVLLCTGYFYSASGQQTPDSYKFSRDAQQGKLIAPVPLDTTGLNVSLVYLGSYLVNAQLGCNDCHTCPSYKGTNPYSVGGSGLGSGPTPINAVNYLSGGTPFQSGTTTITAGNLTPDSSGHPGGLTLAQFKAAMLEGQDPHTSGRTLQILPWPNYRYMYEQDVRAIYEYLSAIPPAPSGAGQCSGERQTK